MRNYKIYCPLDVAGLCFSPCSLFLPPFLTPPPIALSLIASPTFLSQASHFIPLYIFSDPFTSLVLHRSTSSSLADSSPFPPSSFQTLRSTYLLDALFFSFFLCPARLSYRLHLTTLVFMLLTEERKGKTRIIFPLTYLRPG